MALRWALFCLASFLCVHCAGLSWFGFQDLQSRLPLASKVLLGVAVVSVALIACGVARRLVWAAAAALLALAIAATVLAPLQAVNKVGVDRDLLLMLLILPALFASALMIWSVRLAASAPARKLS